MPFVLFAYRASTQESTKESPFYLMYGRDPWLPTALEMNDMSCEEMDVDSYKREVSTKLSEAWELAKKKAQSKQKALYDRQTKSPQFSVGDRVFVYMPAAKACKAYKFARPFYGPYRILEQNELGVVVRPVDKPQSEPIRVAYDRIRKCPDEIPNKFWPTSVRSRGPQKLSKQNSGGGTVDSTLTRQPSGGTDRVMNRCWKDRLRPRKAVWVRTPQMKSGEM